MARQPISVTALRRLSIGISALIVATIFGVALIGVQAARYMDLNERLWLYFHDDVRSRAVVIGELRRRLGSGGLAEHLHAFARQPEAGTLAKVADDVGLLRGLVEGYAELPLDDDERAALATLTRLVEALEAGIARARGQSAAGTGAADLLAVFSAGGADGAAAIERLTASTGRAASGVDREFRRSIDRGITLVKLGLLVLPILVVVASLIVWLMQRLVGEIGLRQAEVEERRRAQAALEAAQRETDRQREKAEAASQVKSQFLATVSHELRTPLTSIRGSLGLVVGGAAGELPAKAKGLVQIAHKNAERLVLLVNDILDIEKIESGRMEFKHETLDLAELVRGAIEANQGYGQQHGVGFAARIEVPTAPILGDRDRLMQVMANLMSNAAKFSPRGGEVEIALVPRGGRFRVAVTDRGPGIPEDFRGRIFERFAQADSSDTRVKGGTGLGLSITRAIVTHLGGEIGFETETGRGTTFHFDMPAHGPEMGAAPAGPGPAPGKRVLVCEDDQDVARLLALLLEQEGVTVDIAHDAAQARQLLGERRYDAATIDIMLPDEDGLSLIRRLRDEAATKDLPVLVVSAVADRAKRSWDGAGLGIVDWLEKPIDRDRLANALGSALSPALAGVRRVLHVEDDSDVVQVVRTLLADTVVVDAVATRAAAREALRVAHYDLVILDAGLPDGSGLDLIEDIQACRPAPRILIFSARDFGAHYASQVSASLVKSRSGNAELVDTIRRLVGLPAAGDNPQEKTTAHG